MPSRSVWRADGVADALTQSIYLLLVGTFMAALEARGTWIDAIALGLRFPTAITSSLTSLATWRAGVVGLMYTAVVADENVFPMESKAAHRAGMLSLEIVVFSMPIEGIIRAEAPPLTDGAYEVH